MTGNVPGAQIQNVVECLSFCLCMDVLNFVLSLLPSSLSILWQSYVCGDSPLAPMKRIWICLTLTQLPIQLEVRQGFSFMFKLRLMFSAPIFQKMPPEGVDDFNSHQYLCSFEIRFSNGIFPGNHFPNLCFAILLKFLSILKSKVSQRNWFVVFLL